MKLDLKTRFDHKYGWWLNERTCRGPVEFSFLPPRFLLPWDTYDSRESASPLQWGTRGGARGTRDPPPPSYFYPKLWTEGPRKNFLRPDSPFISGSGWPPPPPPSYLKVCQSKFLPPSQFPYLGQSILSAQLVNVHFVCATLITPVCLFFVEQKRISRHLYLGLFVMFVLFLIL